MNIKATLEQGYSQKEYIDFIIEYNRRLGCVIEFKDGKVIALEKTDEEKAQEKKDLINHLTCTALDLITFIKSLGLTDEQVLAYLQTNPSFQLQLTFCKDVYCGVVRQLCPIKINEELIITDEQIVKFFKDKNKIV